MATNVFSEIHYFVIGTRCWKPDTDPGETVRLGSPYCIWWLSSLRCTCHCSRDVAPKSTGWPWCINFVATVKPVYNDHLYNKTDDWPPPNWVKKNPLQPGEVSNNKYMYICSSKKWLHCETVALWNSLGTCKTSSIPMRCHWRPSCQRRSSLSLVAVFSVDTARLPCAFAPIFMVRSYFQCCCQSI